MEKITGKNNDLIKNVKKLLSSSGYRREQGLFVLEGARLVFDVLNSFYSVKYFFVTDEAYKKYYSQADALMSVSEKSFVISQAVSDKISDTKNSQGIFAVCRMKEDCEITIGCSDKLIALDNVQDPGNLGSIIRTAEALGINAVIVGGGCDIYNPKVLRSSMGSVLRMNILQMNNLCSYLGKLKESNMRLYSTSPNRTAQSITEIDFSNGGICVIGNEANGVSDDIISISDGCVTIPMMGRAESLNASAAASITMWEMLR